MHNPKLPNMWTVLLPTVVQEEWGKIKPEVCQGLIESMPRWVEAVIEAKGGYTKY